MVEVLVTIVILAFGLLGIASLIMTGLNNNHSSTLRSQATMLSYDMIDRIRANKASAIALRYDMAMSAEASSFSGTALENLDRKEWLTRLAAVLPSGDGSIQFDGAKNLLTVTVQWKDQRGSGEASSSVKSFVLQTQL